MNSKGKENLPLGAASPPFTPFGHVIPHPILFGMRDPLQQPVDLQTSCFITKSLPIPTGK